jgi:hypothetical protein
MFKYQFKSGKYFAGLIKSAELFLKSRLRGLGSSVCMPRAHHKSLFAWQQTLTVHNENTGAAVFSIGSRPLGFKSQKY